MKLIPKLLVNKFSKSNLSIISKLILVLSLILVLVCGILGTNLHFLKNVENAIVTIVEEDVKNISDNATLGRFLSKTFAEVNLLINTFTGQEVFLDDEEKYILKILDENQTLLKFADSRDLERLFNGYIEKIKRVMVHCRGIDITLGEIRGVHSEIKQTLTLLEKHLFDQKIVLMAEGGGRSIMERVERMLPVYHQLSSQIMYHVSRSTREYIAAKVVNENYEQEILNLLEEFDTAMVELAVSGSVFAGFSRELRRAISKNNKYVIKLHELLRAFQPILLVMNEARQELMSITAEIDKRITKKSDSMRNNISRKVSTFITISTCLFFLVISLFFVISFILVKMLKPVRELADTANRLAKGDIYFDMIEYASGDEIGKLSKAFKKLMSYVQEMSNAARSVGYGDLSVTVEPRSKDDVLANAILSMVASLKWADKQTMIQLNRLGALHDIDAMITSGQSLHETLQFILEQAITHLKVDFAAIHMVDKRTRKTEFFESAGSDIFQRSSQSPLLLADEYRKRIIAGCRGICISPFYVTDLTDGSPEEENNSASEKIFFTYHALPIVTREELKGVVEVLYRREKQTDPEWVNFLETLAGQTAIAIHHTELIKGLEEQVLFRTWELQLQKEKLEKEKKKLQVYLDVAGVMFVALNRSGEITLMNRLGCRLLNVTEKEVIGKNWFNSFFPEDIGKKAEKVFKRLMAGSMDPVEYFENSVVTKEGHEKIIAFNNVILKNDDGEIIGTLSSGEDITVKKRMEQEKEKLEVQLRQAHKMEAVGTLAGGIAHEFNNILGIILGYTELSIEDIPTWNPVHGFLLNIRDASIRGKNVVRQLLSFSRRDIQEKQVVDMLKVISASIGFLKASISSNIVFNEDLSKDCCAVVADPTQIDQLMINLCNNAAQAMEERGGVLNICLENASVVNQEVFLDQTLVPGDYVRLMVSDSGHGIPGNILERVFEPFYTTKSVNKGSGLGLSVVHGIVKEHKGFIHIRSRIGEGTQVYIYFPIAETDTVACTEGPGSVLTGDDV